MLTIDKIVIQETPPEGKNVLWGKPVKNGFTLYYYSNGWKPFKLGDNGATVTSSGNRIYYTDSTHSTPLYIEGQEEKRFNIKITVCSIAYGEDLAGAHARILDVDGHVLDEWDTVEYAEDESHLHLFRATDITYFIDVTKAPEGFLPREAVSFTVDSTGQIDTEENISEDSEGNPVIQFGLYSEEQSEE